MQLASTEMFSRNPPTDVEIEDFKEFVSSYEVGDISVHNENLLINRSDSIRILVAGTLGIGKSSFIKSLLHLCGNRAAATHIGTSCKRNVYVTETPIFKYHRLTETTRSNLFVCDSPGFPSDGDRINIDDLLKYVNRFVQGYIRKGSVPVPRPSWWKRLIATKDSDSKMDAVLFIERPPLNSQSDGSYTLDMGKLQHLKKVQRRFQQSLGNIPFFFVLTAADHLERVSEDIRKIVLESFGGCTFLVGSGLEDGEPERMMPSCQVYRELLTSVFREIEEYRISYS